MCRSRRLRELSALAALGVGVAAFVAGRFWAQHLIPLIGIACLAGAAICLALRLWLAAAAWLAAAGWGLAAVVPAYLPHAAAIRPGCRLSVVEFNKEAGRPDDAGAARLLAGLHPDVVFVEKAYDALPFRDLLLAGGFAGYGDFAAPDHAQLILSRFPVVRGEVGEAGIRADIAVAGQRVRLQDMYVTRPNRDRRQYLADMARLRDIARAEPGPLILAGDANTTPYTPEIAAFRGILGDAWEEAGYGLGATFPGPWRLIGRLGPWLRIDYVFHNAAFDAVSARRVDSAAGAGHYPVWVELVLAGAGEAGRPCR